VGGFSLHLTAQGAMSSPLDVNVKKKEVVHLNDELYIPVKIIETI
jgi:hypothetical protein